MSIPKIIHYCWFGHAEKNDLVKKCMLSWKNHLPGFQIIEWNEDTFDIDTTPLYVKEAYKKSKWAFVADYVRLYALNTMGGIYFDTDVEVLKDLTPFLNSPMFLGAESKYSICTAVIGSEPEHSLIKSLMEMYDSLSFSDSDGKMNLKPNTQYFYDFLNSKYGYVSSPNLISYDELTVYPQEYFSPINSYTLVKRITDNTATIHWFNASWKDWKYRFKMKTMALATRVVGEDFRHQLKSRLKSK